MAVALITPGPVIMTVAFIGLRGYGTETGGAPGAGASVTAAPRAGLAPAELGKLPIPGQAAQMKIMPYQALNAILLAPSL